MRRTPTPTSPLARALPVTLLALLLALGGCRGEERAAPTASPTGAEPVTAPAAAPPAPTPLARNPHQRKLDEHGNLLESADAIRGFRLPMGSQLARRRADFVELHIQTKMPRLVQFYASRGYHVVSGRGGYLVKHSEETLASAPDRAAWEGTQLHLRAGEGRVRQLRLYFPAQHEHTVAEEAEAAARARERTLRESVGGDGPLRRISGDRYHSEQTFSRRPLDAPKPNRNIPNVRDMSETLRKWQEAHPDQPLLD